jgi:glycosyltransferase involved in cell wall biosynthesis
MPHATLAIVGPRPAEKVAALNGRDGAIVTGYVDDVRVELWRAQAAVAPLRIARGVQNKVLEAMAAGTPVVATASAAEGIEADPGRDLLVADEPRAFADAILALLSDGELAARIAARGRAAAVAGHSWDANVSRLEALLQPRSLLIEPGVSGGPVGPLTGARREAERRARAEQEAAS